MYRAFFDRNVNHILGRFSIRDRRGDYVVEKVYVRSGQVGHTRTDWARGKSPIPFGSYNLHTVPNNRGQVAGVSGIGEFFPIDNQGDRYTIKGQHRGQKRLEIGLHEENSYAGSAGCIVVVYHSDWLRIRDFLRNISHEYPSIPLEVL